LPINPQLNWQNDCSAFCLQINQEYFILIMARQLWKLPLKCRCNIGVTKVLLKIRSLLLSMHTTGIHLVQCPLAGEVISPFLLQTCYLTSFDFHFPAKDWNSKQLMK